MTLSQSFITDKKEKSQQEEFQIQTISLIAHENMCNRFEKLIHRLYIVILVLIAVIVSTIAGIIYTINQYNLVQDEKSTVSIDSDLSDNQGSNVVLGGNYYGKSEN